MDEPHGSLVVPAPVVYGRLHGVPVVAALRAPLDHASAPVSVRLVHAAGRHAASNGRAFTAAMLARPEATRPMAQAN